MSKVPNYKTDHSASLTNKVKFIKMGDKHTWFLLFILIIVVIILIYKYGNKSIIKVLGGTIAATVAMVDKPNKSAKTLYHGSPVKLSVLEPRSSKVIDGEKAVFATDEKWIAMAFIPRWTDDDINLGFHSDGKTTVAYLAEMRENAFDVFKTSGYVYSVNSAGFIGDPRLGLRGHEFINKSTVKVKEAEHIVDIWTELRKHKVNFVRFTDMAEYYKSNGIPL